MSVPFRVVFMGTPEFAVPSLEALLKRPDLVQVLAVYTQPDRPAGRGQKLTPPPIKVVAQEYGIPVFQPENINAPEEKRKFADFLADYGIVVAYAQFLSPAILNTPRMGCINVHASLLPKYRGASPIQYSILEGDNETGITTIRLVSEMDAGPILCQKKLPLSDDITSGELAKKLSYLGAETLIKTLELSFRRELEEKPQDESQVSFAKKLKKEDGRIDWKNSGESILRRIRAFDPWPGTYTRTQFGVLKIHRAKFHPEDASGVPKDAEPGTLFLDLGALWVRCQNGWIELLEVQSEGKKKMSSAEFLNGLKNKAELSFL